MISACSHFSFWSTLSKVCPKIVDSVHTQENKCLRNIYLFSHQQEKQDSVRAFSEIHVCHLSSINLIMSISLFCIWVSLICLASAWTHLSSTPVWRRGRSWPHRVGPLPRWGTAPAPRSQSSSGGRRRTQFNPHTSIHKSKQAGGLFLTPLNLYSWEKMPWAPRLVFQYILGVLSWYTTICCCWPLKLHWSGEGQVSHPGGT